jgi:hypothetical protein
MQREVMGDEALLVVDPKDLDRYPYIVTLKQPLWSA